MKRRIAFVGCCKEKNPTHDGLNHPMPVRELYASQLFQSRVQYLEAREVEWFVLSAKFGLLHQSRSCRTYDWTMKQHTPMELAAWHIGVVDQLMSYHMGDKESPHEVTVEMHAGREYVEPLGTIMQSLGFKIEFPVAGLAIGKQLQFYNHEAVTA